MNAPTGHDGDLINRLMDVVDHDPDTDRYWWLDASGLLAGAIGGCDDIAPDSDRPATDGAFHWEHRGDREVVARVTWMNRLRLRLAELVGDGMSEAFLVRSLRDHLDRALRDADDPLTGGASRSRYDEWIAEQAVGSDNLELSLVARALMAPAEPHTPTADRSPRLEVWERKSPAVNDAVISRWSAVRSRPTGTPHPA